MLSGSAGPTGPKGSLGPGVSEVKGTSDFGPMTTAPLPQFGAHELGLGHVGANSHLEVVGGADLARTNATTRDTAARRELQKHLLARGMTSFLPKRIAELLADPIFHKSWRTDEGLKWRRHVDVQSVDLDAMGKEAGSRLMYGAFKQALEASPRYLLPGEYTGLVTNVFMSDRPMTVLWHMLGSKFDPYESEGVLKQGVADLVGVVDGAELMTFGKTPQWRIDLGNVLTNGAEASLDPELYTALSYLYGFRKLPTLVHVLNTATKSFMGKLDTTDSGEDEFKVEPMFPDKRDTDTPLKVRF